MRSFAVAAYRHSEVVMFKKYGYWILGVLCILAVALPLFNMLIEESSLDGIDGLMLAALHGDHTIYAAGYSDSGFRRTFVGMSVKEVHRILGEPISQKDEEGWHFESWTTSRDGSAYRDRTLLFRNGKLRFKYAHFRKS